MAIAAAALLIPPTVILITRQTVVLEDFRGDDLAESSSMVAQLLRGERLTPPPPPPPEVFTTAEVRRLRPEIVPADRKWDQIDADLQQRVLAIYESAAAGRADGRRQGDTCRRLAELPSIWAGRGQCADPEWQAAVGHERRVDQAWLLPVRRAG
ncbi:hypothetical protein G6F40_014145 [Rhizopus arrhizus]|nr:hypothetical protein G6F40_014145 [Rhizopus arrhizus]